jgi:single-stranded DNA-binding protein
MDGMNRVYLLGHLGSDPKTHQTKEGKAFCRLNLAVSRNWSFDADGNSLRRTDWHSVLVWGRHGQTCAQYLKKGSPVLVEGYLSSYQVEATTTEASPDESEGKGKTNLRFPETKVAIHADRVTFLPDSKSRMSPEISEPEVSPESKDHAGIAPIVSNEKKRKVALAH